jgi:RNA polymerase sigma-70 factor (ECF subfamily)
VEPNQAVADADAARAEAGGAESIGDLFAVLERPLLGYAFRLARQTEMAQDLVQEAFLRLHAQRDPVREPRRWLFRTVHNLALNARRDGARIVPLAPTTADAIDAPAGEPLQEEVLPPDKELARWELMNQVRQSVERLDERSRELVRLKFDEELSYKEISARTGLSVGHVGYLLHHALKSLAAELARTDLRP